MKIRIVSLAVLALGAGTPALSQAQSSPSVYGVIDAGIESISNVGAAATTLRRMPANTNIAPSRIGFRGGEDLGSGLSAVYTMEMGVDPGTGNFLQGGRGFGRQAFVGLRNSWGTFAIGRQYTMTFWAGLDADILGGGIYGTGSLDSYLPNARADKAMTWRGTFSGLTLGATHSLGRDTVNAGPSPAGTNCPGSASDTSACHEWSLMAKYDTPTWGVALANDRINGRSLGPAPDAVFGGLNSSAKADNRLTVNGWVKFSGVKVGGGLIRRSNDGDAIKPDSDLLHIGFSYPVSAQLNLDGQLVALHYKNVSNYNSDLMALRATYSFSKSSAIYTQLAQIHNQSKAAVSVSGGATGSNPAAGASQTALNMGVRYNF